MEALFVLKPGQLFIMYLLCFLISVASVPVVQALVGALNAKTSFWDMLILNNAAILLNYAPMKFGTLFRANYLKHHYGLGYSNFATFFLYITFLMTLVATAVGLVLLIGIYGLAEYESKILAAVFCATIIGSLFFMFMPLPEPKGKGKISTMLRTFLSGRNKILKQKKAILISTLFLTITFVLTALRISIICRGMDIDIHPAGCLILGALGFVVLFVALTPGSLGLKELVLSCGAVVLGVPFEVGILIAIIDRAITICYAFTMGGICTLWLWRKSPNDFKKEQVCSIEGEKTPQDLTELSVGNVYALEPLSRHSSWKIGGNADMLVEPQSLEQLSRLRKFIYDNDIASIVIGQGSNLLFDDKGFRGIVIKITNAFSDLKIEGDVVTVQAGIAVPRLARTLAIKGLSGIEHTVGIPGTLGGLIAMNGGSQRKNIGKAVKSVTIVDEQGNSIQLSQGECDFSYRASIFGKKNWVLVEAELQLHHDDPAKIRKRLLENLRNRRQKFPRREPNCGSVFLSTKDLYEQAGPPGRIIEDAGLKGMSIGGAQVSTKHANFIVNTGTATASDVKELVEKIKKVVFDKTGQQLQCEVKYINEK